MEIVWPAYILNDKARVVAVNPDGLCALEKPPNVLAHPNSEAMVDSMALLKLPYDFDQQAYIGEGENFFLLNRLDSPVSGIILLATKQHVADAVKKSFAVKTVKKEYLALVKGFFVRKRGIWRGKLQKVYSKDGSTFAETHFEFIKSFKVANITFSVIRLMPVTGRTHQLRIHCAMNNFPIVGDKTYGNPQINKIFSQKFATDRLFLHSQKISLTYEIDGCRKYFQAESTQNFYEFIEKFAA